MKRLMFVMMFLMVIGFVCAEEQIGVFANNNTNSIQFIDPLTMETSANYLGGELGSYGGGLFDLVITPDGKTAIVSNFGDSKIFFIDISGGFCTKPVILGFVKIPFFAEDLEITPDGKYVLVTDGGFSARLAVVDIAGRYLLANNNLGTRYANAVAITPDGKTVVVADYFQGRAHSYTLKDDGTLLYINTAWVLPFRPVNVTISPDGYTAILACAGHSACVALAIDDTGLIYGTKIVAMPFKNGQSCVFSKDGTKAYYLSNSQTGGTKVIELLVTGIGQVTPGAVISCYPARGTSQLFGVDTIAFDPAGEYLYVTNPTVSGGIAGVDILDVTGGNARIGYIKANGIPTGIAFGTIKDED